MKSFAAYLIDGVPTCPKCGDVLEITEQYNVDEFSKVEEVVLECQGCAWTVTAIISHDEF